MLFSICRKYRSLRLSLFCWLLQDSCINSLKNWVKNSIDIYRFTFWVLVCTIFLLIFSWGITRFEPFFGYFAFLLTSVSILLIFTTATFLLAALFSHQNNEKRFLALATINFLVKLFLVVAIPLYYRSFYNPSDSNYIIPYIVIYAVYTIVETWALSGKIRFR